MIYAALLRGINVGGNSLMSMADLKALFEASGFEQVKTYINSGNVLFSAPKTAATQLAEKLEKAIHHKYGAPTRVLIKTQAEMVKIAAELPEQWVNNSEMKCDVMYLWPEVDHPDILKQLKFNLQNENVRYIPGAVLWQADREHAKKSGMLKIIGTPLYKNMTIRNCNTARKLVTLMADLKT